MTHPATPTATPGTAAAGVLTRAASHLEAALQLATAAIGDDTLSPWANAALSIHLAAAGLNMHLEQEPIPATEHVNCLAALRAAQAEMIELPAGHQLPLHDLALVRTCLADALDEARSLQDEPSGQQP